MPKIELGKYLRSIERNIRSIIDNELNTYGLSESQLEYLIHIYENKGINQKELGDLLFVGKASVTKAVKKLIKEGFVYRETDINDKRNQKLFTTDKGRETGKQCEKKFDLVQDIILSEFSQDELNTLTVLLERLNKKTQKLYPPES